VAEKEAKKGGDGKPADVEALLGTLRVAKEAALFHGGTVASRLADVLELWRRRLFTPLPGTV
jgi:hypothetical protein